MRSAIDKLLRVAACALAPVVALSAAEPIVRMTASFPCKIDPAVGYDNSASIAHANLYNTLVTVDQDGNPKPELAKSWKYDAKSKTYTLYLEKGVKFHSGNTITSQDVVYSMNRMLTIGQGWSFIFKNVVKNVSSPSPDTVKFELSGDFGPFLLGLCRVCILDSKTVMANTKSSGTYGDNGDYGKDWLTTHDAGSGPYEIAEMKTAEYLYAKRFPGYWRGVAKDSPQAFKLLGTTEPITVRAMMSRKELEISDEWQSAESYEQLKTLPGVKVVDFAAGSLVIFHMNTSMAPLDDVHVRKALQACFDYRTAQSLFPGSKPTSGPVGSAIPGYNAALPRFAKDLNKAKAELALSRYRDSLGKYEVEVGWASEVPSEEKIALLMQSNAQEIGLKVRITKAPWLTWLDRTSKPNTTPHMLIRVQSSLSFPEAGALLDYFSSTAKGSPTNPHWFPSDAQAEIDRMVREALSTMDRDKRYAKYKAVAAKLVDNATDVWAAELPQRHAYQAAYVQWPAAEAAASGARTNLLIGSRVSFRNMRLTGN